MHLSGLWRLAVGPKAITRIFEGLVVPGLPTPALRHEFGSGVAWKWVNAQFAGREPALDRVRASGLLVGTPFSAEPAGKSLAIRVPTPGVDPQVPFDTQRDAVMAGLEAVGSLVAWLRSNAGMLAPLLAAGTASQSPGDAAPGITASDEREFVAALRSIYDQCDALGYQPTGMLGMIERHGGFETARRLLASPPSDGFARLALLGRLPRWNHVFTDDDRRIAKRRLR